jgi:hypothetical protein
MALGRGEGETLDYTDQQRAAFKDAYARRFRKQLIMMVLLLLAMTSLASMLRDASGFPVWSGWRRR